MVFFTKTDIKRFTNLTNPNGNFHMYTFDDIVEMTKINGPSAWQRVMTKMLEKSCGSNIGVDYYDHIKKLFAEERDNMDLVIISNVEYILPKSRRDNPILSQVENPNNIILGLLITQKNECVKFPTVHTINLICSLHGQGSFLMGLYLYCIKQQSLNVTKEGMQIGLLELANGFINVGGLCMYSKFGFKMSYDLYGKNCFHDYDNLPMMADLTNVPADTIVSIYKGVGAQPKPPVCNIRTHQILLGMMMNLRRFIQLNKKSIIVSFLTAQQVTYNYKKLWELAGKKMVTLEGWIQDLLKGDYTTSVQTPIGDINQLVIQPLPPTNTKKRKSMDTPALPPPPAKTLQRKSVGGRGRGRGTLKK